MSLGPALYSHLAANDGVVDVLGDRIYEYAASRNAALPYVVWHVISGVHDGHMSSATGLVQRMVQTDVYAADGVELERAADALRAALDGYQGSMGPESLHVTVHLEADEDAPLTPNSGVELAFRHRRMEWMVWHTETVPAFA